MDEIDKNQIMVLTVGKKYPLKIPGGQGAIAEFLRENGSTLLILMPDLTVPEIKSVTSGKIECGLLVNDGAILLMWTFFDKKNRPVLRFESPFNARLYNDLNIPFIDSGNTRLLIHIHLIDRSTKIIKGLRMLTMPAELTLRLFSAVKDQLVSSSSGDIQQAKWLQKTPLELFNQTKSYKMGE